MDGHDDLGMEGYLQVRRDAPPDREPGATFPFELGPGDRPTLGGVARIALRRSYVPSSTASAVIAK